MKAQLASIVVRQGKAYIPTIAQTEAGVFAGIEPVYVANLTITDLLVALEKVVSTGHPQIPHPAQEEWLRLLKEDPLLRAAGVKSLRKFYQGSMTYEIAWTPQEIIVYTGQFDHLGRAVLEKKWVFPSTTSLRTVVEAILEDVRSRPELQAEGSEPGQTEGQAQE